MKLVAVDLGFLWMDLIWQLFKKGFEESARSLEIIFFKVLDYQISTFQKIFSKNTRLFFMFQGRLFYNIVR